MELTLDVNRVLNDVIRDYDEAENFLNNEPLTNKEIDYWIDFMAKKIRKDGYYWRSYTSTIRIKANIYDVDKNLLFKDDRINVKRIPAFEKWCTDNGLYVVPQLGDDYDIIIPQMIPSMEEQGYCLKKEDNPLLGLYGKWKIVKKS